MSKRSLGLFIFAITIGSSGVAHAALTINPNPFPVGTVSVSGSVTNSATLSASPTVTIDHFDSTGPNCSEFVITTQLPLTVGSGGGARQLTVRFTPTAVGNRSCTFTADEEDNDDLLTFTVTGTGLGTPAISLTPMPFPAFPDTDVGATSIGQTLTARNTGTADLVITDVAFQTGDNDYALLSGITDVTLEPNETTSWSIACEPSARGLRNGTFRITSNVTGGTTDVALSCTGLQGVVATNPTNHNFQQVEQGSTEQLTFALRNDGNTPITGLAGTLAGAAQGYVFDAGSVPTTLAAGASVNLTVNFTPQDGDDGGAATLTFTGSWGSPAKTTTTTLTLAGDGLGVALSATPTLGFSDFRFDARPELTYQISNTGDVDLPIVQPTFTPAMGTAVGELTFTFTRGGNPVTFPHTLPPGQQIDVTVSPQPNARIGPIGGTVVVHANHPAAVDQNVAITGNLTAAEVTATTTVDFEKVDIDGAAQMKMITVTNTGTAVLDIPAFTATNVNEAFTISTPTAPRTLAINDSLTFSVMYKPTVERSASSFDEGLLVVGLAGVLGPAQAMIRLQGQGIDRHVAVDASDEAPRAFVGQQIGSTVEVVVSNTGEAPLRIIDMSVEPSDEWEVLDQGSFTIDGQDSATVMVRFTPKDGGTRMGELTVMTDDNTEVAGDALENGNVTVPLVGEALVLEARGGGGCSAGGTGGTAGIGALAFGLVLALGRRRRRCAGLVAIAVIATAPAVHAQSTTDGRPDNVDVTVFEPTPATTGTGFQLQSPEVGASGSWAASSIVSYASELFVLQPPDSAPDSMAGGTVLGRSTLLQLGAAFAFLDRFEVGAHMPLYMQDGDRVPDVIEPVDGSARGNLSLHGKIQLWKRGGFAVGTSALAVIPTATDQKVAGSDKPEVRLLLLGSLAPAALGSRLAVTVNAGPVLRETAVFARFEQRSGIAWGVGASYRVLDRLWLTGELFGKVTPSAVPPQERMQPATTLSQIEGLGGLRFKAGRQVTIGLAAGRGVTGALGTPGLRGVLSLAYAPGAPAVGPIDSREAPRPDSSSDRDGDGDGVLDAADKCPGDAEDKDLFDDADGCPEDDNDRDRIADARDKCPLDPEDVDGFQDSDGCAEKDNDGDGIADAQDKCRDEAEDKDGFQDVDGCAELDNDRDGLADADDKCPGEPETINAIKDDDGCPDKGDTTVAVSPDRIEMLDPIVFNGLKLARTSLPVLGQIGATLRAHPELLRVRVTVHVHPTGDPDADQARSEKRAQVIRDWLIQFGIAQSRLELRGFGGTKPLVTADKRGAAKINDRVELIILERK
jgi:outer membrane protein OmpA-like peptidoglycan-associated protein